MVRARADGALGYSVRKMRTFFLCSALLTLACAAAPPDGPFLAEPYVQLGDNPKLPRKEQIRVLWHAADEDAAWSAQYRAKGATRWRAAKAVLLRRITATDIAPHRVYAADFGGLTAGFEYHYRILLGGKPVFESAAHARKPAGAAIRFAVFGDCGQNSPGQKAVAYQVWRAKPDFVAITGDIVYSKGLMPEYRTKYFPVYNSETAAPDAGAPLIRSTLFVSSPGNHDISGSDLAATPGGLAYFLYWSLPLNGPLSSASDPGAAPARGPSGALRSFLDSAGRQFPRMASYSFDYGNSHWTVLDSNKYSEWTSPLLRSWLEKDFASARSAKWRFVIFHHPGFNSSKAHFKEQWMRLLAPIFERGKVDMSSPAMFTTISAAARCGWFLKGPRSGVPKWMASGASTRPTMGLPAPSRMESSIWSRARAARVSTIPSRKTTRNPGRISLRASCRRSIPSRSPMPETRS